MPICMGPPASQPDDGHHGHGAVVVELMAHLEHVSTWNMYPHLEHVSHLEHLQISKEISLRSVHVFICSQE